MNRFQLREGPGIEGLPLIIVLSNALVFLFNVFQPGLIDLLSLSHDALLAGQWWRLVTFLFVPPFAGGGGVSSPSPFGILMMVVWFLFLHTMVTALEEAWGSFRFTVYFLVGAAATAAVGLLPLSGVVTNAYLQASLFLAFATLFPDVEVLLFFLLPIKVKWLGYLTAGSLVWTVWWGGTLTRLNVAAGLVNYFLILGPDLWDRALSQWRSARHRKRFRDSP